MAATYDYTWDQGEDFTISMIYKVGPEGAEVPVNLTSYSLRMDLAAPDGTIMTVLNDDAITDADTHTPGNQGEIAAASEVTLGTAGEVTINLARSLTLVGGAMYRYITANPSQNTFYYDVFLRDGTNKQKKILSGSIMLVKSVTQWQ